MTTAPPTVAPSQRYTRPDGSLVRVDMVKDGWVYFASWRPEQAEPCLIRMPMATFLGALELEGMALVEVAS